jgi:hypothetical protein
MFKIVLTIFIVTDVKSIILYILSAETNLLEYVFNIVTFKLLDTYTICVIKRGKLVFDSHLLLRFFISSNCIVSEFIKSTYSSHKSFN